MLKSHRNVLKFLLIGFLFGILWFSLLNSFYNDSSPDIPSFPPSRAYFTNTLGPRVNFSSGDFMYYELRENSIPTGWWNETYLYHINETHVSIQSEWDYGDGVHHGNITLNLYSRQIENDTESSSQIGFYYLWNIETNVTIGNNLNINKGEFLIQDQDVYTYNGRPRDVWVIDDGFMIMYYDKETGLLLELNTEDFDVQYILTDTNQISSDFHDISISIDSPYITLVDYPTSITYSLANDGTFSEIATYSIWVNNSKVIEKVITLENGIGVVGTPKLNFSSTGWYNITAYVAFESEEDENWEDNTDTLWIKVVTEPVIAYTVGDYMVFHYSELLTIEPFQVNLTYQTPIDECHVQLKLNENGTITYPILNTLTRYLEGEEFTMAGLTYYYQIGRHVSIGTHISFGSGYIEILNETIIEYLDVPMEVWVGNISSYSAYYHKETGVLLGIGNETALLIELTDTNMISLQSPTLISSGDVTREYGDSVSNISWEAFDTHPANYIIQCNSTPIDEATWSNDESIMYEITEYLPGIYLFNISVFNEAGLSTSDLITVSIVDTTIPVISSPPNLVINDISQPYTISWNVSDLLPDYYQLYKDGIIIDQGNWSSTDEIIFDLKNLTVGEYDFELRVYDTSGNLALDVVHVIVEKKTIGLPLNMTISLISVQIVGSIILILSKQHKKKTAPIPSQA